MRNDNFIKVHKIEVELEEDLDNWKLRNIEHTPPITPRNQHQ